MNRVDRYVEMCQFTPLDVPEEDRFLFFEKRRSVTSTTSESSITPIDNEQSEYELELEAIDDRFDPTATGELFLTPELENDIASVS